MSLSLADMRAAVLRNLGGSMNVDADVGSPVDVLNSIINEANHAVETEQDWPWLETSETVTTVAGTRLYTPTAGWYRTLSLVDPQDGSLKLVQPRQLDQWWPDVTTTGRPRWFAARGSQLDIRPVPAAVYALRHHYLQVEPELIDDGDEPLLPDSFRGRIVDMATRMAAARSYRPDGSMGFIVQEYAGKDAAWARRMADDLRRAKGTVGVRVRHGTWNRVGR